MAHATERAPRQMAMLKVKMAYGDRWIYVTLANISPTGFMVRATVVPPVGDTVHIQHRGTTLKGEVVWVTRTRFGVQSFGKIDLSELLAKVAIDVKSSLSTSSQKGRWWHWRDR